jgi:hypothetical protein
MKLDRKTLQAAYFSFIRPILEYGDIVWDYTKENDHSLDLLEQVNTNAARLVCGATNRCNRKKLYEENNWELLKDRRKKHRLCMFYKMVYNLAPTCLLDILPDTVSSRTRHNLRSKTNIDTPPTRLDLHKYSFLPSAVRDWNELDITTKEKKSMNAFKRALDKSKEPPPPLYFKGERRINAYHARLRIGCSALKYDLFTQLHVVQSPACACGGGIEDAYHYFYKCNIYDIHRETLMTELYKIAKFSIKTILYGDKKLTEDQNNQIFDSVHKYMVATNRFT